jgi:hypothetical protein
VLKKKLENKIIVTRVMPHITKADIVVIATTREDVVVIGTKEQIK